MAASLQRQSCVYQNDSRPFVLAERQFEQQYSNIYFVRLSLMRERIHESARLKWGPHVPRE